ELAFGPTLTPKVRKRQAAALAYLGLTENKPAACIT
ncbi:cobalt ABC transporter ATPase, partial [Lacticaseibacillus rhamnosus MTCC 5462]